LCFWVFFVWLCAFGVGLSYPLDLEFSTFELILLACVGAVGISIAFITLTLVGLTSELITLAVEILSTFGT